MHAAKLGLIAGGGALAGRRWRSTASAAGRPLFVVRLKGFAEPEPGRVRRRRGRPRPSSASVIDAAEAAPAARPSASPASSARPDFTALKPDLRGLTALPGAIAAARQGRRRPAALPGRRVREGRLRRRGRRTRSMGDLTLPAGRAGRASRPTTDARWPTSPGRCRSRAPSARSTSARAPSSADGLVLAVEAQEGTDAMLAPRRRACPSRCAARRGAGAACWPRRPSRSRRRRVDLPTIGLATVESAAAAGLAGIVGEAGGVLVLDRAAVIAAADRLGLFVLGVAPEPR